MARKRPWGAMTDSESRLHDVAVRIERERLKPHYPNAALLPGGKRQRRRVARIEAVVEMTLDLLGTDEGATTKRLTALQKSAERELRKLQALVIPSNGHRDGEDPLADLARAANREQP